jgi:hypothetical protein
MARALPCHVRQLFLLLQDFGLTQTECGRALGFTPQAVNNWASGRNQLPVHFRQPFFAFVADQMTAALEAVADDPAALQARRQQCTQALMRWYFELQASRGVSDAWHADLGRRLALTFKTPLSTQSAEAVQAALDMHLEAANMLRRILRLHAPTTSALHPLEETYQALDDPVGWFWALVGQVETRRAETD